MEDVAKHPQDAPAPPRLAIVVISAICAFCILASFSMLRPVRDSLGVRDGTGPLPVLFTATFVVMLLATPVFGWASATLPRRPLLIGVYGFFAATLLAFWGLLTAEVAPAHIGRAFYVWQSVVNLFVVSVFWSLMADLFTSPEAKRLYGYIAAGATLGAIAGPSITTFGVEHIGTNNLLPLAAGFLGVTASGVAILASPTFLPRHERRSQPLGGGVLAGVRLAFSSKLLIGLVGYFLLFTMLSTFLYLEQAAVAKREFATSDERTKFFGTVDLIAQVSTVALQLLVTRALLATAGSFRTLFVLPIATLVGLASLSFGTSTALLGGVVAGRRAIDYAFARPARESLFTMVPAESRYKAKNFIDTVVYRFGDMVAGWADFALKSRDASAATLAILGIPLALVWIGLIAWLNRTSGQLERRADGA